MTRIFAVSLVFLALTITLVDICLTSRSEGDPLSARTAAAATAASSSAPPAHDDSVRQVSTHDAGKPEPDQDVKQLTGYLDSRGAPGISVNPVVRVSSDVNPQRHWQGDHNPLLNHYSAASPVFGR